MEKKYEFTDETMELAGCILRRVRLLRDIAGFTADSVGGWIEKEENLSHDGDTWVFGNARVSG